MAREQWALYVASLPDYLRDFAQKLTNRIEQLLNKDRISLLEAVQRVERLHDALGTRQAAIVERLDRTDAFQERIEERLELAEVKLDGLARRMADMQRADDEDLPDGRDERTAS